MSDGRLRLRLPIPKEGNKMTTLKPVDELEDDVLTDLWEYALDSMADRASIDELEAEMRKRGILGTKQPQG